ncbi:MAG: hypothetical protein RJA70_1776 [Pseudomonadota bacterium]
MGLASLGLLSPQLPLARLRAMRALTLMETVVSASILCSIGAVFVPAFFANLHASRLSEPLDGLARIAAHSAAFAELKPAKEAYPESAPLTPTDVPRGESVLDPPGTWEHPTWRALEFQPTMAHYFSFSYTSKSQGGGSSFVAKAHGDLDGDGLFSTFKIRGSVAPGAGHSQSYIEMDREVE